MLSDLVRACNSQVHAAFADDGRDLGGGEEDEGDGVVLDESDVKAWRAAKLDIGAGEKVEGGLLEATFCGRP